MNGMKGVEVAGLDVHVHEYVHVHLQSMAGTRGYQFVDLLVMLLKSYVQLHINYLLAFTFHIPCIRGSLVENHVIPGFFASPAPQLFHLTLFVVNLFHPSDHLL